MIGKLIIGAVVVGVGYYAYQAYKKGKELPGTTPSSSSSIQTSNLMPKYDPGFEGGCMGCLGGAAVQIL